MSILLKRMRLDSLSNVVTVTTLPVLSNVIIF